MKGTNTMWSHPDVSLASILNLVGGFIDILILASGYQSNGKPSFWEPKEITKALRWASLFEEVIGKLSICKEGKESRRALDAALLDLIACVDYPPGLPKLSAEILAEARKLFIDVFVEAHDVGQGRLISLLSAVQEGQDWVQGYAVQRILKRHLMFSCIKSLSRTLDAASHGSTMLQKEIVGGSTIWYDDDLSSRTSVRYLMNEQEDYCCQRWRQNSLLYLLNTTTLYKLSGALAAFKVSVSQWKEVFDTLLEFADKEHEAKVIEIAELCCLQLASCKWITLIEMLLGSEASKSNLSQWSTQKLNAHGHQVSNAITTEKCAIEAYLEEILLGWEYLLWILPPILIASALSHGSVLYSKYLSRILQELDTTAIPSRSMCPCRSLAKDQTSSDAMERLWCIQIQTEFVGEIS